MLKNEITQDQAFAKVDAEVSIPIDRSQHDFQFTRNWFRNRNQATWSTFLLPKFRGLTTDWPVKMVQIGVFEGADLVWCLQNILTHPESRAIAIDPWAATTKIDQAAMAAVENRARHNLSPWTGKVSIIKGGSGEVLDHAEPVFDGTCDLLVIDGDHNAPAVLQDALNCYRLAKVGGWLVFDDVRNRVQKPDHVIHGIDQFLKTHGDKVKLIFQHRYVDVYEKL